MHSQGLVDAFKSIQSDLVARGFLLCDIKAVSNLPEAVWLEPQAVNTHLKSGSLLLVGHAGKAFWELYRQHKAGEAMQRPDPVDSYSAEITQTVIEQYLPDITKQQLFPSADCPVNLMALGRAFSWHAASPLGMGIHQQYGLWSAYRALWWLDITLDDDAELAPPSLKSSRSNRISTLCAECETQDCVSACPTEAIDFSGTPDLERCADYRLKDASQCESTCLARMACPYAAEHRYTEPQMRYHYELARSSIAKYRSGSQ